MSRNLLTIKELADLITEKRGDTVTVRHIRGNEKRWGLKSARRDLNTRVVRYHAPSALAILRLAKVIPEDEKPKQ